MTNLPLLNKTLEFIQTYPDLHRQGSWALGVLVPVDGGDDGTALTEADVLDAPGEKAACGSSFCFAGWAAILAGYHQLRDGHNEYVVDETGRERNMEDAGRSVLDLTRGQAEALFAGGNSLQRLEDVVEQLNADPDWVNEDWDDED